MRSAGLTGGTLCCKTQRGLETQAEEADEQTLEGPVRAVNLHRCGCVPSAPETSSPTRERCLILVRSCCLQGHV